MKFYLFALVFFAASSILASTPEEPLEGNVVKEESGDDNSEYLDSCDNPKTVHKDIQRWRVSSATAFECCKKAIDNNNVNLAFDLVRFGNVSGSHLPQVVQYAAQKSNMKLLKKIFAHKKETGQEYRSLAKGAIDSAKGDITKSYLEKKAGSKKSSFYESFMHKIA